MRYLIPALLLGTAIAREVYVDVAVGIVVPVMAAEWWFRRCSQAIQAIALGGREVFDAAIRRAADRFDLQSTHDVEVERRRREQEATWQRESAFRRALLGDSACARDGCGNGRGENTPYCYAHAILQREIDAKAESDAMLDEYLAYLAGVSDV